MSLGLPQYSLHVIFNVYLHQETRIHLCLGKTLTHQFCVSVIAYSTTDSRSMSLPLMMPDNKQFRPKGASCMASVVSFKKKELLLLYSCIHSYVSQSSYTQVLRCKVTCWWGNIIIGPGPNKNVPIDGILIGGVIKMQIVLIKLHSTDFNWGVN
jgi:hypothetical protein